MQNPYGGDESDFKIFTLPAAGSVLLWGPEMDVIRTAEFQRLSGIKQLGTSYLVFRGATHTRFEHSLGTLHQAQRLIEAVNRNPANPEKIDPEPQGLTRMFALLHDITHVPFGHTLEDELHLLRRHDENEARLERLVVRSDVGRTLKQALGQEGFDDFAALMKTKDDEKIAGLKFPYVADLVGNTVCADLLDYMERDLRACGMPVALGERFLDFFTITRDTLLETDSNRMALNLDKRRMPRPDVESEVVKLLSYRYELAERVYFHHGKNSASVMIGRALYDAGLVGDDTPLKDDSAFDRLSDELLLQALMSPAIAGALQLPRVTRSKTSLRHAGELAGGVLNRRLFKIAYLGVRDDLADAAPGIYGKYKQAADRRELEDELAVRSGVKRGQVLVHLPSPDMLLKPAGVRVVTHDGRVVTLESWDDRHSARTRAINRAHERLWRVTVYVDPVISESEKSRVRAAAETIFGAPSRYVEPSRLTPLQEEAFDQYAESEGWTTEDKHALETGLAAQAKGMSHKALLREMRAVIETRREMRAQSAEGASGTPTSD
jgi:uncharacterized protein